MGGKGGSASRADAVGFGCRAELGKAGGSGTAGRRSPAIVRVAADGVGRWGAVCKVGETRLEGKAT